MKRQLYSVLAILVILFLAGGFAALWQGVEVILQVFAQFFPLIVPVIKQSFEDYLTSAYFIVGVIIFVCSSVGLVFSIKEKKVLYAIVSGVLDVISLISIFSNLAVCQ